MHRQWVTRAVYLAYEIGDAFNELEAPRAKEVRIAAKKVVKPKAAKHARSRRALEPKTLTDRRLASADFLPEMLPDTEGF